jgi:NAD(P)-dependent dehydrogenase (short-subunit alcohol dehydrogenase family)
MELKNKVALVTGARRGIGRVIALSLAEAGADVVICDTVADDGQMRTVVDEIKALGRNSLGIQANVSSKADDEAMVKNIVAQFGKLDILVNNAGMPVVGASDELEENLWRMGLDVMLTGVFFCCQAAGKEMIKQRSGRIINIASIAGIGGFPERACYGCAKAGVIHLTKILGIEWARYNINVNAVGPGYIKTPMTKELISEGRYDEAALSARIPMGRLGECAEIGGTVVFLASDKSRYITGQTLVVDGGWTSFSYLESWLSDKKSGL